MNHDNAHYSLKEFLKFSISQKQRLDEQVWEWILQLGGDVGNFICLDQTEFVNMSALIRDLEFNVSTHRIKISINGLFG